MNLTDNCDGNETVTIVVKPESRHLIQVIIFLHLYVRFICCCVLLILFNFIKEKHVCRMVVTAILSIQVLTVGENFNSTGWVNTTYDSPAGRE